MIPNPLHLHAALLVLAVAVGTVQTAQSTPSASARVLKAGAATSNIAPPLGPGIAEIPFEAFTETGLETKARSPFKDTFTIELANGANGYLPTPEQHALGGCETWLGTNRVEVEASRKITSQLLELFSRIAPR